FSNLTIGDAWLIGIGITLGGFNQIRGGHFNDNVGSSGIDDSSATNETISGVEAKNNGATNVSLNSPFSLIDHSELSSTRAKHGLVLGHEGFPCNGCRALDNTVRNNAR